MTSGRFITLEGIDGAGKSSHIEPVAGWFRARGRDVVVTREPGGTPLAERLREMVLKAPMDSLTESLLVFAARRNHLQHVIEPALGRHAVVVCDRFTDATFAYQGGGRGFDLAMLQQLELWVQRGLHPDLTLWFDLPPALAAERRARARQPDRFEREGTAFFERVHEAYVRRAETAPWRFARIDASLRLDAVWAQVEQVLQAREW